MSHLHINGKSQLWQKNFTIFSIAVTAMCASIFTLVAIASDRFFAIMFPLKSRITQRRVSLIMAIIWTSAAAIGTPALFFYKYTERQWKDFRERFCSDVWPQTLDSDGECDEGYMSKSTYWIFVLVVLNWFPMVIMLVVYTIILVRLGKKRIIPSSGALSSSAIQQRSKQKVFINRLDLNHKSIQVLEKAEYTE